MSTNEVRGNDAGVARLDMKLEVVIIPVSDVGRAKEFYAKLGWRLDADYDNGSGFHIMQFTPPGSGCSIIFGTNVTPAAPGSAQGLYLIVSDIEAARQELVACGVDVSEVFHDARGVHAGPDEPYLFGRLRVSGPDPERGSYRSFLSFSDPDGNGWLMQEVTARAPGRIVGATVFGSAADLSQAMMRAAVAHGKHEARIGQPDPNWPAWYAEYMVREPATAAALTPVDSRGCGKTDCHARRRRDRNDGGNLLHAVPQPHGEPETRRTGYNGKTTPHR
jgi:catechol 2,3-dioxygenase-like lactoylglutathione lyase family enzyme